MLPETTGARHWGKQRKCGSEMQVQQRPQTDPQWARGLWWLCRMGLNWGQEDWAFIPWHQPVIGWSWHPGRRYMPLPSTKASFQGGSNPGPLGCQQSQWPRKECLSVCGWHPARIFTIHLLCYSDPFASYKYFIPSDNCPSKVLFASLPGELKRGSWVA